MLPFYHFDEADGVWRYMKQRTSLPVSLESLGFVDLGEGYDERLSAKDVIALEGQIEAAKQDPLLRRPIEECSELRLSARAEKLRWFVLPEEVVPELSVSGSELTEVAC